MSFRTVRRHVYRALSNVSLRGRVVEMRADPDLANLDAVSQHYRGGPDPRDAGHHPSTVIVEVDGWHEFHST
jgi:hypothetical protein